MAAIWKLFLKKNHATVSFIMFLSSSIIEVGSFPNFQCWKVILLAEDKFAPLKKKYVCNTFRYPTCMPSFIKLDV